VAVKNPHKKLGNRIKHVLDMTNDLQKNIAKKAGCQPTEISRWVRGEVAPSYHKLAGIARACKLEGQEVGWLFDGKGIAPDYPGYKEEVVAVDEDKSEGEDSPLISINPLNKDEQMRELLKSKDETIAGLKETIVLLKEKITFFEKELQLVKKQPRLKKNSG